MRRGLSIVALVLAGLLMAVGLLLFRRKPPAPPPADPAHQRDAPPPWGVLGPSERVLILGVSGTGKTTWAKRLLAGVDGGPAAARVVIFDPQGDYGEIAVPVTLEELRSAPELLKGPRVALAVQPEGDTEEELAAEVEQLVPLVRAAGRCILVLDEVGDYGDAARKTLSKLARNGRHDQVASVFVTQAAVEIPKAVRRQATRVYSFLQTDPQDLRALERFGEGFISRVQAWARGAPPATWVLPSLSELPT